MRKRTWIAALALLAAAALLLGLWYFSRPETEPGEKRITVCVVHKDASQRSYELTTQAEYLAEVLVEEHIVEDHQGPYGLYILTADGETAEESNQEWWCITKNGEALTTGAGGTPVEDGASYELTFTVGYGS